MFLFVAVSSACRQDMHDNPKYKAYRDGGMRELPEGTVARGSLYLNPAAPKATAATAASTLSAAASATTTSPSSEGGATATTTAAATTSATSNIDGFPFKVTKEILDRGESRYNISCLPCHGKLGDGNGMIVQRGFKRPPAYTDERLVNSPASYFYDVMTNGFGTMPNYTDQLTPEDRWKVAAWIRVLQFSQRAKANELPEEVKHKLENADKTKTGEHSGGHSN